MNAINENASMARERRSKSGNNCYPYYPRERSNSSEKRTYLNWKKKTFSLHCPHLRIIPCHWTKMDVYYGRQRSAIHSLKRWILSKNSVKIARTFMLAFKLILCKQFFILNSFQRLWLSRRALWALWKWRTEPIYTWKCECLLRKFCEWKNLLDRPE